MKTRLLYIIITVFSVLWANAQCNYIRSNATSPDTLTWSFYGGTFASYGCAPIDPTYWMSGYGDSVIVTFVAPQSYPTFRVWGMNTDDSATISVNGVPFPLNSSTASYDAKVVCGLSPGPDGVVFSAGNLVGANSDVQGNYSYQDVQLNATNVTTITVKGLAGQGWGFAGVSVNCPLTGVCSATAYDTTARIRCGDSLVIGNYVYKLGGVYVDTLQNTGGCDSIVTVHLAVIGDTIFTTAKICQGDSVYFYGLELHTGGTYTNILYSRFACDTLLVLTVTVNPLPVVTFSLQALANANDIYLNVQGSDSIYDWCQFYPLQFSMLGGMPAGGNYKGPGIYNNIIYRDSITPPFDYGHDSTLILTYVYSDSNNCSQSASDTLIYDWCEGITEINNTLLNIYPNPAGSETNIEADATMVGGWLQITDATGRQINRLQLTNTTTKLKTESLAVGVYFVQLYNKWGQNAVRKLVIER